MEAQFLVIIQIRKNKIKSKQKSRHQRRNRDSLSILAYLTKCVAELHRQQHCGNGIGTSILLEHLFRC